MAKIKLLKQAPIKFIQRIFLLKKKKTLDKEFFYFFIFL